MPVSVALHPEFVCALVPLRDLGSVLKNGLRSVDSGGAGPLGAPDVLERRAAVVLPPPFRGPVTAYAALRFTPLCPSTYAVLTGYRGAELLAPHELCFVVSRPELLKKLRRGILFTDLSLVSGQANFYSDLSRLDVIDRDGLSRAEFDAAKDPLAVHRAEAEFLVWDGVPPRGIVEIVCSQEGIVPEIEAKIAAAGRSTLIGTRPDSSFFFGRS